MLGHSALPVAILSLTLAVGQILSAQPSSRLTLELADYAHAAHHRRARWAEHEGTAGQGELPARRAGRPPTLRQRPQRAALHRRQADETVHHLPRLQRRRRAPGALPEAHLRAQFRHRPHQLLLRSRLPTERRVLHASHGRSDRQRRGGASGRGRRRPGPVGLHDDASDRDACRDSDRSRGRTDRVEGPESREHNVRGHGTRVVAPAAAAAHPSARRDDLQSGCAARRIPTGGSCTSGQAMPVRASRKTSAG